MDREITDKEYRLECLALAVTFGSDNPVITADEFLAYVENKPQLPKVEEPKAGKIIAMKPPKIGTDHGA